MSNKNIRSSQLLSPFGIGQIINFPKEVSLMVCGLNLWDQNIRNRKAQAGIGKINENTLRINEPRLQKVMGVEYFLKPFEYKTSGENNKHLTIPAVRFPKWHYCTNPRCGRMREVELTYSSEKVECLECSDPKKKNKYKMIPVRFVAACSEGHIQDVPFREWVHNGPVPPGESSHKLSYHSLPGSGDMGSILIKCTCGVSRTLAGIMHIGRDGNEIYNSALASIGLDRDQNHNFSPEIPNNSNSSGQYCKGHRPWLGLEGVTNPDTCKRHLQVLLRGGSNIHYANIISALYLPETSVNSNEFVAKVINDLTIEKLMEYYDQDNGTMLLPTILGTQSVVTNGLITSEELLQGVLDEILGEDSNETDLTSDLQLRWEEYNFILKGYDSEHADLKAIKKNFAQYNDGSLLENYFESVVLIEKLKETRVFTGFSRINPSNRGDMEELSTETVKWLPAVEVFGEGVFLKFRDDKLDEWLSENDQSFTGIINRYHQAMLRRRPQDPPRGLNSIFILMHTFVHLLIKRLCFNCGYGSSSLRERIYFSNDPETRMNGILIYTSSGDSEGSLGGLVRQGKELNLGKLVRDAIEDSRWCSADPVCSEVGQSSGQGPDNINGSACHNCCIVPETSCEEFNMLIDRATITGTLENEIGYFK